MADRLTRLWLEARDHGESSVVARVAFADAVRASQAEVWRFVRHLVGPSQVEEVVQDTFVRAWRSLPRFRGESTARTWLMAIARRAAADAIRREQRVRRNRSALPIGRDTVDDASGTHALHDLIESLQHDQREAFVLTQVIGLTYEEAAHVCDVKIGTIRSRVARAREQLVGDLGRAAEA